MTNVFGACIAGNSPSSFIAMGWQCPRCNAIKAPHINQCDCGGGGAACGPLNPWTVIGPGLTPIARPCAFDSLPLGTYGLVCTCPKCSPQCVAIK